MAYVHCRIRIRIRTGTQMPVLCRYYGKGILIWIWVSGNMFCIIPCNHRVWNPNPSLNRNPAVEISLYKSHKKSVTWSGGEASELISSGAKCTNLKVKVTFFSVGYGRYTYWIATAGRRPAGSGNCDTRSAWNLRSPRAVVTTAERPHEADEKILRGSSISYKIQKEVHFFSLYLSPISTASAYDYEVTGTTRKGILGGLFF